MPWFPEFASAAEMVRRDTRTEGRADPVRQYFTALNRGDSRALEEVWPGEVVVYDPHAGEVRGHQQLRRFVRQSQSVLAKRALVSRPSPPASSGTGPWSNFWRIWPMTPGEKSPGR